MAKTGQDRTIYAGDDAELPFTLTDANGDPLDLTGARLRWACAATVNSAAVITKDSANGDAEIEITSSPGFEASVWLVPADTMNLSGVYRHELEIIDGAGKTETLATGKLTIKATIL